MAFASAAPFSVTTALTTKTLSPEMIGEPEPRPGIATFHFTFSVSLHCVGGLASSDPPFPVGPRHWFQSWAPTNWTESTSEQTQKRQAVKICRDIKVSDPGICSSACSIGARTGPIDLYWNNQLSIQVSIFLRVMSQWVPQSCRQGPVERILYASCGFSRSAAQQNPLDY